VGKRGRVEAEVVVGGMSFGRHWGASTVREKIIGLMA